MAKALGISEEKLFSELRSGKTLAQVAKAHDKSLDDVKKAARDALEERLDKAVEDDDLTQKQADQIRKGLNDAIDHLGERRGPAGRPRIRPAARLRPEVPRPARHRGPALEVPPGIEGGSYGAPRFTQ